VQPAAAVLAALALKRVLPLVAAVALQIGTPG
jgi:hypothetical protein